MSKFNSKVGKSTANPFPFEDCGKGICPKCKDKTILTRHHIYPRRFFQHSAILKICRECHNELERLIPRQEQMHENFYLNIVKLFLKP